MRPPRDSKSSPSSDFTFSKQKKSLLWQYSANKKAGVDCLDAFATIKIPRLWWWCRLGRDIAGAFVICAALTLSPPDFVSVGGDSNQDIGGPFCQFGFFVYNSINDTICLNNQRCCRPTVLFSPTFCSLASAATKRYAFVMTQDGGGSSF
jgi:hypothetical protein